MILAKKRRAAALRNGSPINPKFSLLIDGRRHLTRAECGTRIIVQNLLRTFRSDEERLSIQTDRHNITLATATAD